MKQIVIAKIIVCFFILTSSSAFAKTQLSLWYNDNPWCWCYTGAEIVRQIIDDFNASQSDWVVSWQRTHFPSYNDSVKTRHLPDIFSVDSPMLPNWAWAGYLAPLTIDESKLDGFLPGSLGRWNGELYAIGLWDAANAIFARKSVLEANGIRIPTLDAPWNLEEFDAALVTLQNSGDFDYALDLGMAMTSWWEWYPYAFGPFLQSFGGDIIDVEANMANGALNGDAGLAFGEFWQSLFARKLAPGPSQDSADRLYGFIDDGSYALQWNGNWAALPALKAFGDDMLFLPAPDFGTGPKIGVVSRQFGISSTSEHKDGASAFIEFAIQDKYLSAFSKGIGLIPPTEAAIAMTSNYSPGGPLDVFYDLSNTQATLRAVTPAYVVGGEVFKKAMINIANGADVADTLDAAADEIDADINQNNGYQ